MRRKLRPLVVFSLLFSLVCYATGTASAQLKAAKFSEKVKAGIAQLGTGPDARIEVKLRDKTKLKGYVSEISDDRFTLKDDKTNTVIPIAYPQVKQVKGNNLSSGAKIAIGVGIVVGIIILLVIGSVNSDG